MKRIAATAVAMMMLSCANNTQQGDATGTFDADEVIVSAEVPGKITTLPVSLGDVVTQGQLVAVMDSIQIHLQKEALVQNIEAMRSQLPDVEAQLASYREQLTAQQREMRRVENLVRNDAATQKQFDDLSSAVLVAQKQLDAQQLSLNNSRAALTSQIAAARIQIEQLDDQIRRCRVTAPIGGTVLAKYANAGELAQQGRPLVKISDTQNIHLKAYLTANQLAEVKLGQKVRVSADYGGGTLKDYDGTVVWISDKSEFTPRNIVTPDDRASMVYAVKIAVPNDGYIKIGMYGVVYLQ